MGTAAALFKNERSVEPPAPGAKQYQLEFVNDTRTKIAWRQLAKLISHELFERKLVTKNPGELSEGTTDKERRKTLSVREPTPFDRNLIGGEPTHLLLHSKNDSAVAQRSSTFNVIRSSARVRPRFTAAIGMRRCAAAWAKRKPE